MTVPAEAEGAPELRPDVGADEPREPGLHPTPAPTAPEAVAAMCPYLTASGGSWRMATPSRDHRCGAVDPPAPQATDKQRRHCLSDDHVECPIFRAARSARAATLAGGADPQFVTVADRRRRPLARTAPILLERPRLVDQAVRLQFERGPGQVALIALMIVAFAIVALTRLSVGADPAPVPVASQAVAAASPSPTRTPASTPSPSSSVEPSASPSAAVRTYRVKKGDTLLAIAKKYGTTAAKIKTLNGLKSSTLKVGQILKIP
jgi:LysM repeat protein